MKKIALHFLLLTLVFTLTFTPARAQGADWVALQSDATAITTIGQTFIVTVSGAVQTPINGIGVILRYDPACVKVNSRQTGTLFANQPVREFLGSNSAGKLDVTYYLEGQTASVTGEGSFFQVTFEALAVCNARITLDKDTLVLGVRQANGLSQELPGVEVRGDTLELASASEPAQASAPTVKITDQRTIPVIPVAANNTTTILLVAGVGVPLLAGVGVLVFGLKKPALKIVPPTPGTGSARNPRLLVESGSARPRSFALKTQRTLIGRHSDCAIQLDGRGISHQHAEISERDGVFYLADLRSHYGTYLNGKLLEKGYYPLRNGAEIKIGSEVTCRFVE